MLNISLNDAKMEPRLKEMIEKPTVLGVMEGGREVTSKEVLEIALALEGLHRQAGMHAAGVVIADKPLWEFVPVYQPPGEKVLITQFAKDEVEAAGLVKFDFLGLKTLTVLAYRGQARQPARHRSRSARAFRSTMPRATQMLARGETVGVFQVEGQGMRRALTDMQPDRFEDIIALVALYRPGPMANIPTYCARKHGKEQPEYIASEAASRSCATTFGVIVYQEQVHGGRAAALAGYIARRSRSAAPRHGQERSSSEMDAQRERFVAGAVDGRCREGARRRRSSNCSREICRLRLQQERTRRPTRCVAYQTAYMKANYPVEFLAASMTYDMANTDKLAEFRAEALRLGVKVEPPSINRSGVDVRRRGQHDPLRARRAEGRRARSR